jgi:PAS domain S-box-containing protein
VLPKVIRDFDTAIELMQNAAGTKFFEQAVLALSAGLDARWVGIVRRSGDGRRGEFLACAADGRAVAGKPCSLDASPCAEGYARDAALRHFFIPEDFDKRYPTNELGESTSAVAYRGEVFLNRTGKAAGHVFIMDDRPMRQDPQERWFLHLVGRLVGAEYNRWQVELEADALRQRILSARDFRGVVESSPLGLVVHRGGKLLFVNDAAARMFGCDNADAIMRASAPDRPMMPAERERLMAFFEVCTSGHDVAANYEARYRRKGGEEATVEILANLVEWEGESAIQLTLLDAAQRRAREARVHEARRMEVVEQLTGGVAHDFNNILSIILGNLDLAREQVSSPAVIDHIDRSMSAAGRAASLTHHLLSISRRQPLQPEAITPQDMTACMEAALAQSRRPGLTAKISCADDLWTSEADPRGLRNAIGGLAANAADALCGEGTLSIAARNVEVYANGETAVPGLPEGDYVCVSVSDNGMGMPPEVAKRAFEPFFTTKAVGKGSGLGLSVIHGFARQSGGSVTIKSAPGQGTTVAVYLPRRRPDHSDEDAEADAVEWASGRGETLLVVEDDAEVRKLVTLFLKGYGYDVLAAENAAQAEAWLDVEPGVDLLLTDVQLPGGVGGVELMARCLARRPDLAVLFMSGHAGARPTDFDSLDREVKVLQKPFRRREIASAVRSALDARCE